MVNAFSLDVPPDNDFERNGRGEPKIVMPDGTRETYSRASTFSNYLEDGSGYKTWEMHHAMLGVAKSDQLIDRLRPLDYEGNYKLLVEAADEAHVLANLHAKADYGTGVHAYLDPKTNTAVIPRTPGMADDVRVAREYREAIGAEVVGTEIRCVNDRIRAAGTYDGLWTIPGIGTVIVDWKTGKWSLLSWTIQQAIYADSEHYDIRANRGEVAPELARSPMTPAPRTDWAVVMWAPRGERNVRAVPVNLNLGRMLIARAQGIRVLRSQEFQKTLTTPWTPGELLDDAPAYDPHDAMLESFTSQRELEAFIARARVRWQQLPA